MPSTVIRAFAYRPEGRELEVLFTTGRRYIYQAVPAPVVAAFRAAPSKGRYFNAHIRGRYSFTEVEREEEEAASIDDKRVNRT
jgi:hypothetical protein